MSSAPCPSTAGVRTGSISRPPRPELRPFVALVWAQDGAARRPAGSLREHVLPGGGMHLVFRLSQAPLRLFDGVHDDTGHAVGHALVGGARTAFYVRDISSPSASVGALLRPGAAQALFGMPAGELSGRHTRLEDLWGGIADELHEQFLELPGSDSRLALLEAVLMHRLARAPHPHPAVVEALRQFRRRESVGAVVERTGYSHRHFIELFRHSTGFSPKAYGRVLRFQAALHRLAADPARACAQIALDAGYSDQAHFSREFRALAGVTPAAYRALAPAAMNHVGIT